MTDLKPCPFCDGTGNARAVVVTDEMVERAAFAIEKTWHDENDGGLYENWITTDYENVRHNRKIEARAALEAALGVEGE